MVDPLPTFPKFVVGPGISEMDYLERRRLSVSVWPLESRHRQKTIKRANKFDFIVGEDRSEQSVVRDRAKRTNVWSSNFTLSGSFPSSTLKNYAKLMSLKCFSSISRQKPKITEMLQCFNAGEWVELGLADRIASMIRIIDTALMTLETRPNEQSKSENTAKLKLNAKFPQLNPLHGSTRPVKC